MYRGKPVLGSSEHRFFGPLGMVICGGCRWQRSGAGGCWSWRRCSGCTDNPPRGSSRRRRCSPGPAGRCRSHRPAGISTGPPGPARSWWWGGSWYRRSRSHSRCSKKTYYTWSKFSSRIFGTHGNLCRRGGKGAGKTVDPRQKKVPHFPSSARGENAGRSIR